MNSMTEIALQGLEELTMGSSRPVIDASVPVQGVVTETDRKIAAVELGLSEDATWGRINRVAEADSVASPCYRR